MVFSGLHTAINPMSIYKITLPTEAKYLGTDTSLRIMSITIHNELLNRHRRETY